MNLTRIRVLVDLHAIKVRYFKFGSVSRSNFDVIMLKIEISTKVPEGFPVGPPLGDPSARTRLARVPIFVVDGPASTPSREQKRLPLGDEA